MPLHLTPAQLQTFTTHATQTYPEECCGILLGHAPSISSPNAPTQILEIWPTPNAWNPEIGAELATLIPHFGTGKTDRFYIAPPDLLAAQRHARDRQINIIGFYHSHPDHPATPSESDRRLAWPAYIYLILSIHQGQLHDHRAWKLDDNHQFQPEVIFTTNPQTQP